MGTRISSKRVAGAGGGIEATTVATGGGCGELSRAAVEVERCSRMGSLRAMFDSPAQHGIVA